MYGGNLYGSLGGKEEQPFDRFNFLFGELNKKKINSKNCFLFPFPLSDNINRKIYQSIHPKTSGASKYI